MKSKVSYITLILFVLLSGKTIAQEFIVKNFKEVPTDISAREYEVLDVNDEPCALLKIYTGLSYVKIDGNRGVEKTEVKESVIWVWVPQGTRQIKISKDGMVMLPHIFPAELKASRVYSLDLTTDQLVTATISTPGVEAEVEINKKTYKTNQPIPDLAEGDYSIRVFKLGYATVNKTVSISLKNNFFSYNLERTEQARLSINSKPTGCVLFVNGNNVGTTNHTGFYFPGEYHINISKVNYISVDTLITFDPKVKSSFTFDVVKNTSFAKFSCSEDEVTILIDGKKVNPLVYTEINAGVNHELEIRKPKFRTYKEAFKVSRNDTIEKKITLEKQKGEFSLIIEPNDALIELENEYGEKFSWQGSKVEPLPVGKYELIISRKGFLPKEATVEIKDQEKTYFNDKLTFKNISPVKAGVFSVIPGLGQMYAQRKTAGIAYMTSTLALAGASGFLFLQADQLGSDYTAAKEAYAAEKDINKIVAKGEAMDQAYADYQSAADMRNMVLGVTAGLYLWNIIDAVIFSKKHAPSINDKLGENLNLNLMADPLTKSTEVKLSYRF